MSSDYDKDLLIVQNLAGIQGVQKEQEEKKARKISDKTAQSPGEAWFLSCGQAGRLQKNFLLFLKIGHQQRDTYQKYSGSDFDW